MEHRRGQRLPISLPVSIRNQHSASIGSFIVKDISTGGMSVIDPDERLSKGDFVYLEFGRNSRQFDKTDPAMKAIVVYRNKRTVGLMWAKSNTSFRDFMQTIVTQAA